MVAVLADNAEAVFQTPIILLVPIVFPIMPARVHVLPVSMPVVSLPVLVMARLPHLLRLPVVLLRLWPVLMAALGLTMI